MTLTTPPTRPSLRGQTVRRGLLVGAAAGLLVGLIWNALVPLDERAAIVRWRNCILWGTVAGLALGLFRPLRDSKTTEPDSRD